MQEKALGIVRSLKFKSQALLLMSQAFGKALYNL